MMSRRTIYNLNIFTIVVMTIVNFFLYSESQAQSGDKKKNSLNQNPTGKQVSPDPYSDIDNKALQIPDSLTKSTNQIANYINSNFSRVSDKVRAAFIWVVTNIRYDLANMYAIDYFETNDDKIAKALLTRQGICENYAAVYVDICRKLNFKAEVVEGYVKQSNHVSELSHSWCAVLIDTTWFLFDPTWASGTVINGAFVPKINNSYYEISPSACVQTHMPFDPIWQLLYHPLSFTDFNAGKLNENPETPFFNFPDSISAYLKLSQNEKDHVAFTRIDNNGAKSAPVFNRLQYLKQSIEKNKYDQYNAAVINYNNAISNYNDFARYYNKQFTPVKPDAEIQAMLDSVSVPFHLAKTKLGRIKNPDANIQSMMGSLQKQMNSFSGKLEEQEAWLAKYFSKGKTGRKTMFIKLTPFGSKSE